PASRHQPSRSAPGVPVQDLHQGRRLHHAVHQARARRQLALDPPRRRLHQLLHRQQVGHVHLRRPRHVLQDVRHRGRQLPGNLRRHRVRIRPLAQARDQGTVQHQHRLAPLPARQRLAVQDVQAAEPGVHLRRGRVQDAVRPQRRALLRADGRRRRQGQVPGQRRRRRLRHGLLRRAVSQGHQVHQRRSQHPRLDAERLRPERRHGPLRILLHGDGHLGVQQHQQRLHAAPVHRRGADPLHVRHAVRRRLGQPLQGRLRQGRMRQQPLPHGQQDLLRPRRELQHRHHQALHRHHAVHHERQDRQRRPRRDQA
ncbi:hypothetical protein Gpo141_00014861, partial [Globisporangium polare]